jgi:protein-tyrosine phosphatase
MNEIEEKPTGLIDLHAHVVPGVDDGAPTEKDALTMLQLNIEKQVESILEKRQEFLEKVRLFDFKLRVLAGAEVFFTSNLNSLLKKYDKQLTLNQSCFFILEFPFDFIFPGVKAFIFNILMEGRIPIIAHPERNQVIQRNPRILFEMVEQGALSQVNAGSLDGQFGPEARTSALQLIRHNLVHVVASDAHSIKHRPPKLSSVYDHFKEIDPEKADLLFKKIPEAILKDKAIPDIGEARDPQKQVKFFDMIRNKLRS